MPDTNSEQWRKILPVFVESIIPRNDLFHCHKTILRNKVTEKAMQHFLGSHDVSSNNDACQELIDPNSFIN
jgi:hypothetical protein